MKQVKIKLPLRALTLASGLLLTVSSFAFVLVLFFAIIFTVSSVQNYKQNISSSSLSS
jgi:hypothetical protein